MRYVLRRQPINNHKVSGAVKDSLLRKLSKLKDLKRSSEDPEPPYLVWGISDQRPPFVPALALLENGEVQLIAMPLQCCDHSNKLDPGGKSVPTRQQNVQRRHPRGSGYSNKQHTSRDSSKSDLQRQSEKSSLETSATKLKKPPDESNKSHSPRDSFKSDVQRQPEKSTLGTSATKLKKSPDESNKPNTSRDSSKSDVQRQYEKSTLETSATELNKSPDESISQNSFPSNDSSGLRLSGSDGTNSSDMSLENIKAKTAVKNAKKKARKKGKQKKASCNSVSTAEVISEGGKQSCDSVSTAEVISEGGKQSCDSVSVVEVTSEGGKLESLASQTCANSDMGPNDSNSCATSPPVSVSESRPTVSSSKGDDNNVVDYQENLKECASFIDEADASNGSLATEITHPASDPVLDSSESHLRTRDAALLNPQQEKAFSKRTSYYDDSSSQVLSEMPDSLVLDSVPVRWNRNGGATWDGGDKRFNRLRDGIISSRPAYYASKGFLGDVDSCNDVARGFSNLSDMQSLSPSKRGKQAGRARRISNMYHAGYGGNIHGRLGKENSHSVWQRVQKNDASICDYELRKTSSVFPELDISSREASLMEDGSDVGSSILSKSEDANQSKVKTCRKPKRKISPESKQNHRFCSDKGSDTVKASSDSLTTSDLQQMQQFNIQNELNRKKVLAGNPPNVAPKAGLTNKGATSDGMCSLLGGFDPVKCAPNTVSAVNIQAPENNNSSQFELCDSSGQPEVLEVHSSLHFPPLLRKRTPEAEEGFSVAESSRQDHSSGSVMQKWVPVGLKGVESTRYGKFGSSLLRSKEPNTVGCTLKNIAGEESPSVATSTNNGTMFVDQRCADIRSSSGEIQSLLKQNPCLPKTQNSRHMSINSSVSVFSGNQPVKSDSEKIAQSVEDACRVRSASEAVLMTTGSPIAEFERFVLAASPVVCPSSIVPSCQFCMPSQGSNASLCRHETPSVSLEILWQWYEKPGSYGLEVKAEDGNPSRLGSDRFAFGAYFVPFLSAIQLFGNQKICPEDGVKDSLGPCERFIISGGSSNPNTASIFSMLIPQPYTAPTNTLPIVNQVVPTDRIASLDETQHLDDPELLFEYFEYEPPQHRRPLFEKILDLIKGGGKSQAFGDPAKLFSLNLQDVHPRSWYSVAWYPVYKIPDGNFRAAFLTYHSFGHLFRRSASNAINSRTTDACIVSPVVGLQSYNAQGESWFHLKQASQLIECPRINASAILRERLKTLEQAASHMSRSVVKKGNVASANRHPDYEFFLSRRR